MPQSIANLAEPAERARLSASALRAFFKIVRKWELSEELARALLGGVPAPLYQTWRIDPTCARLDEETTTRISLVIGIFKALNICFSEQLANQWVRLENNGLLFAGQAPIDFMIRQGRSGMADLRRLLDSRSVGR